ncbi:tetraprenyl-beta-curcumene synthase family protein [Paenibacillus sp. FSL R7-0297]|uniref:tetraprenyl-beta-curcumene synthase family protein n=1 Tax=unclassified Paenibacillus TaxID=185978 RepID=UPI0004F633F5|nr:tetraprenyl-beta-curcumene synthase family protein [Paenibacillus sp. FSL R5-0912]AIQ40721.1 tetraprenyl-beta-curcumene synthase [Paenibacillus sp. FSL R5-0912]
MNEFEQGRYLSPRGPIGLMNRVYKYVLPEVRACLDFWRQDAEGIPDPELRKQALASIETKQFHCEGGGIYAAGNLSMRHILIPLIVAYQTISDYLDNLCDRSTSLDPADFRLLHQSMLDAINPEAEPGNYYELRNEQNDGGYLYRLVRKCQEMTSQLPGYAAAAAEIRDLAVLYTDLQVYKHIRPELREAALKEWWEREGHRAPHLGWNEFAAATGSTLGVFMLFLASCDPKLSLDASASIRAAYFPHVCGLHIMLDYLIDQDEDRAGGDLNFCNYYDNTDTMLNRIASIVEWARKDVRTLPETSMHRMVIEGLLALYLSDPKVSEQREVRSVSKRLMRKSPLTRLFFFVNSRWIRKHMY